MCQKGSCAEGRVAVPTARLCKARFAPLPAGYRVVEKKTDSGPDFRLARSRYPSASGRRIGPSPGDGWAARRDPKPKSGVFYDAGL